MNADLIGWSGPSRPKFQVILPTPSGEKFKYRKNGRTNSIKNRLLDLTEACATFHIIGSLIERKMTKISIFLVQNCHPIQIILFLRLLFPHFCIAPLDLLFSRRLQHGKIIEILL